MEIGGLVPPKSAEAKRICEQDIKRGDWPPSVQDRQTVERGVFDDEDTGRGIHADQDGSGS